MKFGSTPELEAVIDLLFEPNENSLFIDGTAPPEDFISDPEVFVKRASERLGVRVEPADLKLTIPEFARRVKNRQEST